MADDYKIAGNSNVGNRGIYGAGDQRNVKQSDVPHAEKFNEGQPGSHDNLDPKDERSIANRLEAEEKRSEPQDDLETARLKRDPTLPATMHGNEPSKGAKIDAELQAEDEQRLREKQGK